LSLKYPHLKNMIRSHKNMLEQTVELEDRTAN